MSTFKNTLKLGGLGGLLGLATLAGNSVAPTPATQTQDVIEVLSIEPTIPSDRHAPCTGKCPPDCGPDAASATELPQF